MAGSTTPVRVGIVSFLNSWPLAWAFLTGRHDVRFEPRFLPPAQVADQLMSGEVQVGLIPSAELQRIPDLRVVPGLCVASDREVTSVLLVSKVPVEEIRRVGLDANSRTSAVLVQILLAARGVTATYRTVGGSLDRMLEGHDAALLIGDAALEVDRDRFVVVDLAREWRRLTDLPFVFAVWAVRGDAGVDGLTEALEGSLRLGESELDAVIAKAGSELGIEPDLARRYLTENLSYRLDGSQRASLGEFFRLGAEGGLLPPPREVEYLESRDRAGLAADRED